MCVFNTVLWFFIRCRIKILLFLKSFATQLTLESLPNVGYLFSDSIFTKMFYLAFKLHRLKYFSSVLSSGCFKGVSLNSIRSLVTCKYKG